MTEAGSKAVAQRLRGGGSWAMGEGQGPRILEDQEWPRGPEYEI